MTAPDPGRLDAHALRRAAERAAATHDAHAVLHARINEEMLARLDLLAFEPAVIVDLGCRTGEAARALKRRWRKARVIALDAAPAMLAEARTRQSWFGRFERVCADALRLPFAAGSVDLVYSNLWLPWAVDLDATLAEVRRVVKLRGYFTFATLGPDTLKELRAAWAAVDESVHVHRFLDMHDIGDALLRAGFADPVMDVDRHTLTYANPPALLGELRGLGAQNALVERRRGLTGRARFAAMEAQYARRADADGRICATCEVIYGQAWCPGVAPPVRGRRGESVVPIESLRRRP